MGVVPQITCHRTAGEMRCSRIFGLKRKSFGNSYKEKNVLDYEGIRVPAAVVCESVSVSDSVRRDEREARMPSKVKKRKRGNGKRERGISSFPSHVSQAVVLSSEQTEYRAAHRFITVLEISS